MSIKKEEFNNEKELHDWVETNITKFFGDIIYLTGNFLIYTKRNKGAKPDGFVLDLKNSSWMIVESELLKHGIWDHIAEQVVRFIVAAKSDSAKRKIRDYFFDELENRKIIESIAKKLNISETRVIQKIENILETTSPEIALFIDDINEDLEDIIEALNTTTRVFKIEKFNVNEKIEYFYPDNKKSTIETTVEEIADEQGKPVEVLEILGGGEFICNINRIKIYKLNNSDIITIKYSKYYDREPNYWYGITPASINKYEESKISHICFTIGTKGIIKIPFDILVKYVESANKSTNPDGSVRHYHIQIRDYPKWELYTNDSIIPLDDYIFLFEN